ncbi:alpha/beta hydrolase [Kitasatospora sp. NPDC127111]|uniref:alpha/beta hydrolase n=1 Tax=Kitasatospora sp. NPDC127111 TaxID=3345363 RepID=UPI00364025F8
MPWYSWAVYFVIPRLPRRALLALATTLAVTLPAGCTGSSGAGAGAGADAGTGGPVARPPIAEVVAATTSPALRAFYDQQIAWTPCTEGADADEHAVLCGNLKVPLDYAEPEGATLDVAVVRVPATDQHQRLGSLVFNPGGPANSGTAMLKWGWKGYQGPLHDRYDLVSFDPRGAGGTSPVTCLDDATREEWTSTDDPAYDHGRILADACQAKYPGILPHLGTRDVARDLDVLRGALGERKLDFLGFSYGTHLGALYAEEFPDRTGRLVLDGAVERSADLMHLNGDQAAATENEFEAFAADCAASAASCPLGTDPAAAPKRLADFLDGLRDHPLSAGNGRRVTATLGWNGVLNALYDGQGSWERVRTAIEPAITRGDADELLKLADGTTGRDADGHFDTIVDAYAAIHCADAPLAPTDEELRQAVADLAVRAPLVGRHDTRATLLDPDCRPWPFRSPERPHTVKAPGSAPILVVGSTGDPVTPYVWAQRMASGFEHGTLLTREGDGHTAYWHSRCVRTTVTAYLVDGTMPEAGTICPSD